MTETKPTFSNPQANTPKNKYMIDSNNKKLN